MTAAVESDFAHVLSPGGQPFWKGMSSQMVCEAEELLSHVEMYIKMRSPTLGFPPVFVSRPTSLRDAVDEIDVRNLHVRKRLFLSPPMAGSYVSLS